MSLRPVPCTLAEANGFINLFHRHNGGMPSAKLSVAAVDDEGAVHGVAIAGLPKARRLMERGTLEVNRVCTDGERNCCSFLYGCCIRAAKALGYTRLYTYTLSAESGASLKASGWVDDGPAGGGNWYTNRDSWREQTHDGGDKRRWVAHLADPLPDVRWPQVDGRDEGQVSVFALVGGNDDG